MPFMLIVVGLVLVITSIQNTYAALGAQITKDFSGSQGFLVWILALIAVGALGYVPGWEKFSRWFLALILIAIILAQSKNSNAQGGIFGRFLQQIKNPVAPAAGAGGTASTTGIFGPSSSPTVSQTGQGVLQGGMTNAGNLNAWIANPSWGNWNKFLFGK